MKPKEIGSDVFGLWTHSLLPLLQWGWIQPFLTRRFGYLLPFPIASRPGTGTTGSTLQERWPCSAWKQFISLFTEEINAGKGISFNIKITDSSDLLDLVCEVLYSVIWRLYIASFPLFFFNG